MLNRRQRQLTEAEIKRVAAVYHAYRNPVETFRRNVSTTNEPGFCKVATLAEVQGHDYKLTPGIYVGTQADEDDGEAFEEKMPRLIDELRGLFAESDRLQAEILRDLEGLGGEQRIEERNG
jgi:type I restriction enzyme M protein